MLEELVLLEAEASSRGWPGDDVCFRVAAAAVAEAVTLDLLTPLWGRVSFVISTSPACDCPQIAQQRLCLIGPYFSRYKRSSYLNHCRLPIFPQVVSENCSTLRVSYPSHPIL